MTTPIAEDFDDIRIRLEMLEREKAKALSVPLPEVQPIHTHSYLGHMGHDYDPA
jgi:hypothetical protein